MEIVITGRNTEIASKFRSHVESKLAKVGQLAPRAHRVEVVLSQERNPRRAGESERIEITVRDRGPVIRAEAKSSDRYGALDLALSRLLERLRRARDRHKTRHRSTHQARRSEPIPADVALPVTETEPVEVAEVSDSPIPPREPGESVETQLGDSPVVVRQKLHEADPMTVDQALYEMELVGHPFFLFIDADTGQPCVVYHRHGWTYGVIRLNTVVAGSADDPNANGSGSAERVSAAR